MAEQEEKYNKFLEKVEILRCYIVAKRPKDNCILVDDPYGETLASLIRTIFFNGVKTNPKTGDRQIWAFVQECAEYRQRMNDPFLAQRVKQVIAMRPKRDTRSSFEKADTCFRFFMQYGYIPKLITDFDNQPLIEKHYTESALFYHAKNREKLAIMFADFADIMIQVADTSDLSKKIAPVEQFIISPDELYDQQDGAAGDEKQQLAFDVEQIEEKTGMEELQKVPSVFDKLDKLNNPDPFPTEEEHDKQGIPHNSDQQKDEQETNDQKTQHIQDLDNAVFEPSEESHEAQTDTQNRSSGLQYQPSSTFDTEHTSQPNMQRHMTEPSRTSIELCQLQSEQSSGPNANKDENAAEKSASEHDVSCSPLKHQATDNQMSEINIAERPKEMEISGSSTYDISDSNSEDTITTTVVKSVDPNDVKSDQFEKEESSGHAKPKNSIEFVSPNNNTFVYTGHQNYEQTLFTAGISPCSQNIVDRVMYGIRASQVFEQQQQQKKLGKNISLKPLEVKQLDFREQQPEVFQKIEDYDPDNSVIHEVQPNYIGFEYRGKFEVRELILPIRGERLHLDYYQPSFDVEKAIQAQGGVCPECSSLIVDDGMSNIWLCQYSGKYICPNCKQISVNIPADIIKLDCKSEVFVCKSSAKEIAANFHIPVLLNEVLPYSTLVDHDFAMVLKLRKQLLICYDTLNKCSDCITSSSSFVNQYFSEQGFQLAHRLGDPGSVDLRPETLLTPAHEHLCVPELAVLFQCIRTGRQVVESVGYWSLQDLYAIRNQRLLNLLMNALVQIQMHISQCKFCCERLHETCICGVVASLAGIDVTICKYCGAVQHEKCWKTHGGCYVCGNNQE